MQAVGNLEPPGDQLMGCRSLPSEKARSASKSDGPPPALINGPPSRMSRSPSLQCHGTLHHHPQPGAIKETAALDGPLIHHPHDDRGEAV